MELYLKFLFIGFSIALPVGAITVEMTKQGLKNGFFHGWAVGIGAMTIDVLLIVLLHFGLADFLLLPYIQLPLWIVGSIFLFMLAYDSIKNADEDIASAGKTVHKSIVKTFRNGFLVAVSPGSIMFWLTVFGSVLADARSEMAPESFRIVACGILTGILLHDIGLLMMVTAARKVMNRRMVKRASITAGILLFGFGCYFLYKFYLSIQLYL